MVAAHETEARRGAKYERVMFTRLEFEWLQDHPPLQMLDPAYLWLPTGEARRRRPTPCLDPT